MNAFGDPDTTMTPEEAEAVVQRYLTQAEEMPTGPTVAELAEVLHLAPEQVGRLLAEVRAAPKAKPRLRSPHRERIWLLSGVLAVLVGGILVGAMRAIQVGPFHPVPSRPLERVFPVQSYEVFLNDIHDGTIQYHENDGPPSSQLPTLSEAWLKDNADSYRNPQSYSFGAAQRGIELAKQGKWYEIEGVTKNVFELRLPNAQGLPMRWARAVVPIYDGDDSLLAAAVQRERRGLIGTAIAKALEGVPPSLPID